MPLTPDQWERVKDIVASVLELPAEGREDFVRAECQGDQTLFREAMSLLQYAPEVETSPSVLLKHRYRVLAEIGRGGFAVTYLALDQDLHNRRVVVKMLSNRNAEPYIYQKFEQEIQALSILEHPNIITPLDCGRTENNAPFLVMQFAEGETLRDLMRVGALERSTVAAIIRQLGSALAFAHQHGIIHRDIKPENIMVQTFGDRTVHVRLIDFGIASAVTPGDAAATRIIGSVPYMAPEQFRGEVSSRSDVFALGVLIYEMLNGTLPFDSKDPLKVVEMQRSGRIAPSSTKGLQRDPQLDSLIVRALAYVPDKRPANVSLFTDEVAGCLTTNHPRRAISAKRAAVGLTSAGILLAAALLFFIRHQDAPLVKPAKPISPALKVPQILQVDPQSNALALIQFERRNTPGDVPVDEHGALRMMQQDQFRLRVQARSDGHLYIFSRSVEASDLHILFPSPTANQGRSLVEAYGHLMIPAVHWLNFGTGTGTETVIFVWSATPDPLLEDAKRWANPRDQGAVPSGPAAQRVLELLARPNSLKPANSEFQLLGKEEACGWLTIIHR